MFLKSHFWRFEIPEHARNMRYAKYSRIDFIFLMFVCNCKRIDLDLILCACTYLFNVYLGLRTTTMTMKQ
jgi:hypothetical protein